LYSFIIASTFVRESAKMVQRSIFFLGRSKSILLT